MRAFPTRRPLRVAAAAVAASAATALAVANAPEASAGAGLTLELGYSDRAAAVGTTRAVVFTVHNTNPPDALPFYWEYTVPNGLSRPLPPSTDCLSGTVDDVPPETDPGGVPGGGGIPGGDPRSGATADTLYFYGETSGGQVSCTFTVPITSAVETAYSVCPQDLVNVDGVTIGSCAFISFEAQHPHRAAG
ncbi:hypothetical protein V5P93_005260 [Actinokineospora auranticolor]|uniref:Ribosomally synthesized peptide with SipW-like signal peptide n=1 Tax=Actinokineospora auranticolor TaxID=155976 RepID=A0A2S6GDE1_9PSEU|nr:hypothetical protein [Actinokineospora auranticolor]PPK63116.1 hypothetical protein CLV40_13249 [Actinokineospora auranticolor]